jgi:NCAIR mutase (PurE)-related protein
LRAVLRRVREGRLSVKAAMEQLRAASIEELGFATVDLERAVRKGFAEVVFGPGKTPDQIAGIVRSLRGAGQPVLVTRVGAEVLEAVRAVEPRARYHPGARAIYTPRTGRRKPRPGIVVVTAGTADLGVAEEAALTAELMGNRVERIFDVGVAGLHRLVPHRHTLVAARVIVAVAGMDGVLPTVLAGMFDCPVIGVPTSTGYGSGEKGRAALLTMLNSCAAGLTVVNIDNGFGAGFAAALVNRQ